MPDSSLVCCDCGSTFLFTEAEQEFFRAQGFTTTPRRCKACRARNRRRRPGAQRAAGNGERSQPHASAMAMAESGGPVATLRDAPSATGRGGDERPRRPHDGPKHATVCSVCGAATEVPFVPDGVRPVFCLPCLKKQTR